jgi:hypothetical protein
LVLQAVKPSAKNGNRASKEDVKSRFGLNVFYDNPPFLREIRSDVLRLTAQMLQAQGLKLSGKPYVKRDVLHLNEIPMFSEYLVPPNEDLWPTCYAKLGDILRSNPQPDPSRPPLAQSFMEDMYTAGRGMIFPTVQLDLAHPHPNP